MSLTPGSVWLDARGIQSIGHAGRGIARHVLEQAIAIVEAGGESIGWVGLDPDLPLPVEAQPLLDSGRVTWSTESPTPGQAPPAVSLKSAPVPADVVGQSAAPGRMAPASEKGGHV